MQIGTESIIKQSYFMPVERRHGNSDIWPLSQAGHTEQRLWDGIRDQLKVIVLHGPARGYIIVLWYHIKVSVAQLLPWGSKFVRAGMRGVLEIDQSSLGEVGLGLDEEVREREWLFNCSLIPSQSRCSVWPAWGSGHMSLFPVSFQQAWNMIV